MRKIAAIALGIGLALNLASCQSMDFNFQKENERANLVANELNKTKLAGYEIELPYGGEYTFEYKDSDMRFGGTKVGGQVSEECRAVVAYAIEIGANRYLGNPAGNSLPDDESSAVETCVTMLSDVPEVEGFTQAGSASITFMGEVEVDGSVTAFTVDFHRYADAPLTEDSVFTYYFEVNTDVTGFKTEMTG